MIPPPYSAAPSGTAHRRPCPHKSRTIFFYSAIRKIKSGSCRLQPADFFHLQNYQAHKSLARYPVPLIFTSGRNPGAPALSPMPHASGGAPPTPMHRQSEARAFCPTHPYFQKKLTRSEAFFKLHFEKSPLYLYIPKQTLKFAPVLLVRIPRQPYSKMMALLFRVEMKN